MMAAPVSSTATRGRAPAWRIGKLLFEYDMLGRLRLVTARAAPVRCFATQAGSHIDVRVSWSVRMPVCAELPADTGHGIVPERAVSINNGERNITAYWRY